MLYFFFKAGRYLVLKLPLGTCYKVAIVLADIYRLFARDDRRNLEYNLSIVLKTNDRKLLKTQIKNIFRNFAKYLVDFFRFSKLSRDYILKHITIEGKENLDKMRSGGKGAILLSAHLGNWELGAAFVESLGYPFYAITLDHKDKKVNNFFLEQRATANVKIIPVGAQLKNCFKVLRENSFLAIVGDRDFSNHGVKADFFGRSTILPRGPASFSLKTGAPIVPTFLIRKKDDTFRFIVEEPLISRPTGDKDADIKRTIEEYMSVLERYIQSFPDQWYAFRRMWD